ncbi:MAG TPA: transferrin receptor-like dimerization domain-containing protein [Gemmatimonadales bacterium]
MLKRHVRTTLSLGFALTVVPFQEQTPIRGFTAESSRAQRDLERRFRDLPSPDSLRSYMRRLTARPQHLGSPYGKDNAEWLVQRFKAWGFDAAIEEFEVLFPTPRERRLELLAPTRFLARLTEPPVPGDTASAQQKEQLPTYNAYSIDGDVTGPLVFVNYGVPADYERLERLGVSVKGAIVIAKYGGSWRGIKPKVAAEHGAIGCIIYSDPADDGYGPGETYPAGPFRPKDGVQRGSVMDMPLHPGDPLTPGVGATAQARRLPLEDAQTLTKIPVLPISYADAQPLLAALGGRTVPAEWRGGLPITYHLGPGPARVRLALRFNWDRVKLYNVIVRIPGAITPDEWVIRGNHRDGWVNGAEDPISGLVPLMEELRAMSELMRSGWRPRRTIIYAAWDGEEQGLLGSTEWAEAHADELRAKAVAYLNTDSNGRGFLYAAGSHTLQRFINEVAREITDPETRLTVWKRSQLAQLADGAAAYRAELRGGGDLRIPALGSGSDYSPFLQHLGIASLHLGFGGEGDNGIYHSIYDNFRHYTRFNDTSFVYGRALAQTTGSAVLRLGNAEVLPFHFGGLSETVAGYRDEVKSLLSTRRDQAVERNRQLDEGVFQGASDPREPMRPPPRADVAPAINFAPLDNGLTRLQQSAERYEAAFSRAGAKAGRPNDLNRVLLGLERTLGSPEGLPRRPWYRHLIYAPGFYTGYGVKTLPGIREALEQGYWAEAERETARIAASLTAAAHAIDSAAVLIEGPPGPK